MTRYIIIAVAILSAMLASFTVGQAQPTPKTHLDVSTRERLEFAKSLAVSAIRGGCKFVSWNSVGHETVSSPRDVAHYCRDLSEELYDSYEKEER